MNPHPKSRLIYPAAAQKDIARVPDPFDQLWKHRMSTRVLSAGLWFATAAVILWGFEYRLLLYRPHPSPAERAAVARLRVEPRSTDAVRLLVSASTHNPPIYFAEALRYISAPPIPFRLRAPSADSIAARVVSASPRSPPYT
jgi:hypothetical protein